MRADLIEDAIRRGLGAAARALGDWCDLHRPSKATGPVAAETRIMKLQAAFSVQDDRFARPASYGQALWWGYFDAAYAEPGDYLRSPAGTWFVAAKQKLLPVLCVRAERMIDLVRPAAPSAAGLNAYGGILRSTAMLLMGSWPASMLTSGAGGIGEANLPSDPALATWQVLLPKFPEVILLPGDLLSDDLGRNGVVGSAELTALGWRLQVKQVST